MSRIRLLLVVLCVSLLLLYSVNPIRAGPGTTQGAQQIKDNRVSPVPDTKGIIKAITCYYFGTCRGLNSNKRLQLERPRS